MITGKLAFHCPSCDRDIILHINSEIEAQPLKARAEQSPAPDEPKADDGTPQMPWGKHRGKPLDQVPVDYWAWLLDQKDPIRDGDIKDWVESNADTIRKGNPNWKPRFPERLPVF